MLANPALEDTRKNMQATDTVGVITVSTSRFGSIEVSRDKIINMTSPFLGFPESKRFFLKQHGVDSPFMWLQSLDNPKLAFVVVQPELILSNYRPLIPVIIRKELHLHTERDLQVLIILSIPQGRPREMTANLLGPVVFNVTQRLAKQVLLDPIKYNPCWPVFSETASSK